jgi:hypothetical protein
MAQSPLISENSGNETVQITDTQIIGFLKQGLT